jgi:hypothetical protein
MLAFTLGAAVDQIFAAPLAQAFGLDALCNLQTDPISILIDVGRVMPEDWLLVVAHEYAHAHAGTPDIIRNLRDRWLISVWVWRSPLPPTSLEGKTVCVFIRAICQPKTR